jgi:hypothetical protein
MPDMIALATFDDEEVILPNSGITIKKDTTGLSELEVKFRSS